MKNLLLLSLFLFMIFSSCTKEGPEGPAGADGQDGQDGNANVWSETVSITSTDWISYNGEYSSEKLLSKLVSPNDLIMVYVYWEELAGDYYYRALPFTTDNGRYWSYSVTEMGWIDFIKSFSSSGTTEYKVVVAENTENMKIDVDWKNYEEVKEKFNLE